MQAKDAFHIGGTWVPAPGREPLAVIDPATEEQVSSVPAGHAVRAVGWGLPGRPGPGRRRRRRLRTGMVDVNGGRFNPLAPFGGYKQSGNGRELGEYGLEELLEVNSLQL